MKNIDELIELNSFDPISRYSKVMLDENVAVRELALKIMMLMKAIDDELQDICCVYYHFYVKDDETIYNVLRSIFNGKRIEKHEFDKAIFILDFCKLIYKFTCAKKFQEEDLSICQLRLNSWGREYIEFFMKNEKNDYTLINKYIASYFKKNIQCYLELAELLLTDLKSEQITNINKLNAKVAIKLLS